MENQNLNDLVKNFVETLIAKNQKSAGKYAAINVLTLSHWNIIYRIDIRGGFENEYKGDIPGFDFGI
jgi:hypothetical protein